MSVAASVGSSVGKAVASSVARTAGGLDADAVAYFAAVEAAGGSFDLTGVNATYTTSYVKKAHSDLFAGLKADGIWTKITELYLLSGKTYAGMAVKAKGSGTLTLTNFVSGDYLAAGSGAGLLSAATKQISTNFAFAGGIITDSSLGVYVTSNNGNTSYNNWIGANGGDAINTRLSIAQQSGTQVAFENSGFASGGRPIGIPIVTTTGHFVCTRRTSTDAEGYRNGVSVTTNTASDTDTNSGTIILFNGGVARISASHVGVGLTDTDAANLSTRINAFMTALGANVY